MIKCMSLFSQILSEISLSSVSFEQLVMKHENNCNANVQHLFMQTKTEAQICIRQQSGTKPCYFIQ